MLLLYPGDPDIIVAKIIYLHSIMLLLYRDTLIIYDASTSKSTFHYASTLSV